MSNMSNGTNESNFFPDNLLQISSFVRKLMVDHEIPNVEQTMDRLAVMFRCSSVNTRQYLAYFFYRLLQVHQCHIHSNHYQMFDLFSKLFLGNLSQSTASDWKEFYTLTTKDIDCGGVESKWNVKRMDISSTFNDLMAQYGKLCQTIKCDAKHTIVEDLFQNGIAGQCIEDYNINMEQYVKLCDELLENFNSF